MANSLFQQYGRRKGISPQFRAQFSEFQKNFVGDPKAKVQELLNAGQMSQDEFNRLSQIANEIFPELMN